MATERSLKSTGHLIDREEEVSDDDQQPKNCLAMPQAKCQRLAPTPASHRRDRSRLEQIDHHPALQTLSPPSLRCTQSGPAATRQYRDPTTAPCDQNCRMRAPPDLL